jgi:SAM-dependent methyltransferase
MDDTGRCFTRQFWASLWRSASELSPLRRTQASSPERWKDFYDEVSEDWEGIGGDTSYLERKIGEILVGEERLLREGAEVLEIGCGAGRLALALAERGLQVTALDDSEGMLGVLNRRANLRGVSGLTTRHMSWFTFQPARPFDLVLAAFFPPAWEPEGLTRIESLSKRICMLVTPIGEDAFPIRRQLWTRIMKEELPRRSILLPYLVNYLIAGQRRPNLQHLRWETCLDLQFERVEHFYSRYFALFGKKGSKTKRMVREVLLQYNEGNQIRCQGNTEAAVLWWSVPHS